MVPLGVLFRWPSDPGVLFNKHDYVNCRISQQCQGHRFGTLFEHTCAYARWALIHRFLSVCLSVTRPKVRLDNMSLDRISDWTFNLLASNSMMAIANCNSGVKSCYWQVCSIQRQVAFLALICNRSVVILRSSLPKSFFSPKPIYLLWSQVSINVIFATNLSVTLA